MYSSTLQDQAEYNIEGPGPCLCPTWHKTSPSLTLTVPFLATRPVQAFYPSDSQKRPAKASSSSSSSSRILASNFCPISLGTPQLRCDWLVSCDTYRSLGGNEDSKGPPGQDLVCQRGPQRDPTTHSACQVLPCGIRF